MSTIAYPTEAEEPRLVAPARRRRLPSQLYGLVGIAAIAALLPLRSVWAVDVVLIALVFTVPGVLGLRALRISASAVAEYPLYIPAASLLVLMIGGAAGDLIGPPIGIAHPLHGYTTAVSVLALTLVLWVVGLRVPAAARVSWRSLSARPSLLLPLVLPALSAAGALLLTNGHGDVFARVSALVMVLALFGCLLCSGRLSRGQVAMLLFAIALGAEWAFTLRSQEIVGYDISTELYLAQHTQALGVWHLSHHHDAYGAMLSITVLPSVLSVLTGCSPLIAFKVLYPVLFALLPVSVFLVARRFMRKSLAAGAAALVLVQSYFFQQGPQLARQEIALVLFAALVSVLLHVRMRPSVRVRLCLALAVGVVVSHYSTTYLAMPAVLIALVLQACVSRFRRIPVVSMPVLVAAVALVAGSALWYGAATHSAGNFSSFVTSVDKQGLDLLPNSSGNLINGYLNGNAGATVSSSKFEQLALRDYRSRAAYIHPLAAADQSRFDLQPAHVPEPRIRSALAANGFNTLSTVVGELMLLCAGIGAIFMIFGRARRRGSRMAGILALATVGMLAFIRFSGTAAVSYNQSRALLQSLLLLAIPAAWVVGYATRRWQRLRGVILVLLALTLSLVFAYQDGLTAAAVGGGTDLNLSQRGEDFERNYMSPAELAGAKWASDASRKRPLYADRYGQLRLYVTTGRTALTDVTPRTIDRGAWVYGTRSNVVLGRARGQVGNSSSLYQWPATFLNAFFDTMYANNDGRVYHR